MLIKVLVCCVVVTAVVAVTATPVCGTIYSCGCTLSDGAQHCNVHRPGEPHCPWCTGGMSFFLGLIGVIWAMTCASVLVVMRRFRLGYAGGLATGLAAYLVWAGAVGLVVALASGYPTWFGLHLRG